MAGWIALAVGMVMVGMAAGAPGVLLVAVLTVGYASLTEIWTRYGTARLEYERHLTTDRAVAGDDIGLDVSIWNRKALPLPWVTGEDRVPERLRVREREEMPRDDQWPGTLLLRNDWALGWYERVVRHFHLDSVRRGSYRFGPANLGVRDVVGRLAREERVGDGEESSLVVAPAMAPLRHPGRESAPLGERRTRHALTVDPSLYAGVRPFQQGDSLRLVHWRATARIGHPVSRRLEPARGREVVLVVDVQTVDGSYWLTWDEDAFESLCVIAASVARRLLEDGAAVGAAAANFAGSGQRIAWLAPRASVAQLPRIGELLARIGPVPSAPLGTLLGWLPSRAPSGSRLLLLSTRDPVPFLATLRRAQRLGFGAELIAAGPQAEAHARSARLARIPAQTASIEPGWEVPRAIALAG
ncbi:MAG TPA: DUF58 domain-containing protein [Candidatus Limnocylindria bacterium]|jgi:uncharacterized protein (DUF58 family)|nr:DUF58 domain-containing protein [Candidatus Limnocylindria bacterium]